MCFLRNKDSRIASSSSANSIKRQSRFRRLSPILLDLCFTSIFRAPWSYPVIASRDRVMSGEWRQVNPLTRLHLTVVVTERHANESICVCPQGTDGIPGAEVQLAFDYRSSSGATATQSDTVWPARGNDDAFCLIYPGDCLEKKKQRKRKKKSKRAPPLFASSVRFRRERSSVLRLSPSFVRNLFSHFCFFSFSARCTQLHSWKSPSNVKRNLRRWFFQYLNSQLMLSCILKTFRGVYLTQAPTSIDFVHDRLIFSRIIIFVRGKSGHSIPDIICARANMSGCWFKKLRFLRHTPLRHMIELERVALVQNLQPNYNGGGNAQLLRASLWSVRKDARAVLVWPFDAH